LRHVGRTSFLRFLWALAGGATAAELVALVEARATADANSGAHAPTYGALFMGDLGVLLPLALIISAAVAAASLFLEPRHARSLPEHAERIRAQPVLHRSRTAAMLPLATAAALTWCVGTAHVARDLLAQGSPITAGVSLAVASGAILFAIVACALAVLRPLRRLLAAGAATHPRLVDPVTTGGVSFVIAIAILAWGVHVGDTGGDGGALGIFGVLKRSELDLRPAVNLLAIAMAAYITPIAFAQSARAPWRRAFVALVLVALPALVTTEEARAMNGEPAVAESIARNAPLGKAALAILRKLTDHDKDGASPFFGGGDCDDRNPRRSPLAVEVPDNDIDEDCSGADLHVPAPAPAHVAPGTPPPRPPIDPDLNVVFITVDTLRTDVGFMGYPKAVTPNLDRLAEKSVVFDRMYAMASYTGKSLAPLFIGKYPSETDRDGGHFNTYFNSNTFLAERLRKIGVHTMGAASHWYFAPWAGLAQGMEVWDLSSKPPSGQGDNDTSITSAQLSDAALRILKKEENTSRRFFLWLHYFDPHEQYMPHEGAPSFGTNAKALYDGEVWFTDRHIGRVLSYIEEQPWGAKTAIVVTADHGEAFGEHNMRWHGYEIWEPLVRVPMLIYVPGMAPHRVPVKRSHIDIVPTMLDVMGVPPPPPGELSGQSMMIDLVNKPGEPFEERDVLIDMPPGPFTAMRHALIHGDTPGMKLIRLESGQYQLFDLASDPDEKEDLASDKEKLGEMIGLFQAKRATLKEIVVKPDAPPPPP
jgi:choline-sulfatase